MSLTEEEITLLQALKDAGQKFIFLSPNQANSLVSVIGELIACIQHDLYWEPSITYDAKDYKGRTYQIYTVKSTSIGYPVSGEASIEFPNKPEFDVAIIVGLDAFYEFSEGYVIDAKDLYLAQGDSGSMTLERLRAKNKEQPEVFKALADANKYGL